MLIFLAWAKLGVTTCFVLMASSLDFESVRHCIGAAWCLGQPNASWLLMESDAIPWLWIDVLSAGAWRDGWVRFPLSVDFSSVSRHTFPRGIQNLISSQCPHFLCAHWKWFCFNAARLLPTMAEKLAPSVVGLPAATHVLTSEYHPRVHRELLCTPASVQMSAMRDERTPSNDRVCSSKPA